MSELYEVICKLCARNGITVTELCRKSGASRGSLSDLKMGRKSSLSAKTLQKIADYFGVTVDYLLGNEEKKPIIQEDNELAKMLEEVRRNPDLRAMFSLAKNATPEEVRQYINVIKAIKGDVDE